MNNDAVDAAAALKEAVSVIGGGRALGRLLGLSHSAVRQWQRVPAERVLDVERASGVPRDQLRPDLYRQAVPMRPLLTGGLPLRDVARRAASRAVHSLLADDPDLISGKTALLLARRLARFLEEELRARQ